MEIERIEAKKDSADPLTLIRQAGIETGGNGGICLAPCPFHPRKAPSLQPAGGSPGGRRAAGPLLEIIPAESITGSPALPLRSIHDTTARPGADGQRRTS